MVRVDACIEVRSRDHNVVYHIRMWFTMHYLNCMCVHFVHTVLPYTRKFSPNACHWRKISPSEKFATSGMVIRTIGENKIGENFHTMQYVRAIGKFFTGKNFCVYAWYSFMYSLSVCVNQSSFIATPMK